MSEITFDGVHHNFGDRVVLRGVDLTLTQRRIGVVGGNGSGKSTLARMINGLHIPERGRVLVDGEDTRRKAAAIRRRVGFVLGTVGGSVVSGEESFDIEWREDTDEVWFTVRAFDAPVALLYRLPGMVRRRRRELFSLYLRAISPLYATPI